MAQFPNAVVSFATKNPGDVIPSADWNAQNAEITAIEDGYLNGTARLNSSASTLASLSVTGGSTFAGIATGSFRAPFVLLTNSTPQDVANNVWTGLSFDTETVDTSNLHSTSVNSSRIVFGSSGAWLVGAYARVLPGSSGTRGIRLLLNDTNTVAFQTVPEGSVQATLSISALIYATATTDYATVVVLQDSGSTGSASSHAATTGVPCTFWAQRMSV